MESERTDSGVRESDGQQSIGRQQGIDFVAFPQYVENPRTRFDIQTAIFDRRHDFGRHEGRDNGHEECANGKQRNAESTR